MALRMPERKRGVDTCDVFFFLSFYFSERMLSRTDGIRWRTSARVFSLIIIIVDDTNLLRIGAGGRHSRRARRFYR